MVCALTHTLGALHLHSSAPSLFVFPSLQENTLCLCIVNGSAIWQMLRHNGKLVMTNKHYDSTFQFGFAVSLVSIGVILHSSEFICSSLPTRTRFYLSHLLPHEAITRRKDSWLWFLMITVRLTSDICHFYCMHTKSKSVFLGKEAWIRLDCHDLICGFLAMGC